MLDCNDRVHRVSFYWSGIRAVDRRFIRRRAASQLSAFPYLPSFLLCALERPSLHKSSGQRVARSRCWLLVNDNQCVESFAHRAGTRHNACHYAFCSILHAKANARLAHFGGRTPVIASWKKLAVMPKNEIAKMNA
jgi:hypothetical protein